MNRLFTTAITDGNMSGAYLATAPTPVSNAEFMRELRKVLGVPFGLPAKSWMVRIAAPLILRTDPELALYGRYCVSRRLREEGFDFLFPDLPSALRDLYQQNAASRRTDLCHLQLARHGSFIIRRPGRLADEGIADEL